MRLWHKDLLSVLPRQQLLGQWRECCCIAKNIAEKGTPNHILVNRIMDYPIDHFYRFCVSVKSEMQKRNYKCDWTKVRKYFPKESYKYVLKDDVFKSWHNDRYYIQCYYNLQEKYDCNGITDEEWDLIHNELMDYGII